MRSRAAVELSLLLGLALVVFAPKTARADDDGHRFGLVAGLGGGFAGVVHSGPLPGVIGFTDLGVEFLGEIRPWGGFLRADFLSSGNDGRWTAYAFGLGTQYRLFGTTAKTALFLRGGLTYERWLGNNQGCPVTFVVPNSCNLLGVTAPIDSTTPPPAPFSTTADMLGLTGGIRLEVPISAFYLAVGATFVPTVSLDASYPTAVFALRFDLEAGFRDTRKQTSAARSGDPDEYRRRR
jgi:hypothetical protein